MNRPTKQAYAIVGGIAITQLFFGVALAIFPGWPTVGTWFNSSAAASWAQAVVAGVAILAGANAIKRQVQRQAGIEDAREKAEAVRRLQTLSYAVFKLRLELVLLRHDLEKGRLPSRQMVNVELSAARIRIVPILDIPTWQANHAVTNSLSAIDVLKLKNSQISGPPNEWIFQALRLDAVNDAIKFVFDSEWQLAENLKEMGSECPSMHFEFDGRVYVNGRSPNKPGQ